MKYIPIIATLIIFGCTSKSADKATVLLGTDTTIVSDVVRMNLNGKVKTISYKYISDDPATSVGTIKHFTKDGFAYCEILTTDDLPEKRGDTVMWIEYLPHKHDGHTIYHKGHDYFARNMTRHLLLTDTSYIRYNYDGTTRPTGEYMLSHIDTTFLSRDKHIVRTSGNGYSEDGNGEVVSSSKSIYLYNDSSIITIGYGDYAPLTSHDTTINTIIKRDSLGNPTVYYTQRKSSLIDSSADTTYCTYEYYE